MNDLKREDNADNSHLCGSITGEGYCDTNMQVIIMQHEMKIVHGRPFARERQIDESIIYGTSLSEYPR